jgi:tetratricopeptide (TPR) repeat protein
MRTRYRVPVLAALLPLVLFGVGCNLVKAKAAFKDGNRLYKEENYRKAIEEYEKAVALKPDFAEAHFYLASSEQSLFRPGKTEADNRAHLDKAIEHYEKSLEANKNNTPNLQSLRLNTLGALTAIYADPPGQSYDQALGFAEQLVKDNPNDTKNLYAMANLYEKFGRIDEAQRTYEKVAQLNPSDAKACGTLASFYNKPLWDEQGAVFVDNQSKGARRGKFTQSVATLEHCADLDPNDPKGHNTLAMFYWDKAYRDPSLSDKDKNAYADKGIEAIDAALKTRPDYWEAIISRGLLYRVKAQVAPSAADRKKYLEQAQLLQKQAMDLRKEAQAGAAGASGATAPTGGATTP